MRAKHSRRRTTLALLIIPGLVGIEGCAGAKRFLPPGFVKYEDLAKDQPVNTEIQEATEKYATPGDARFPKLRDQPSIPPKRPAKMARDAATDDLSTRRDDLAAGVEKDMALADAERETDVLAPVAPDASSDGSVAAPPGDR